MAEKTGIILKKSINNPVFRIVILMVAVVIIGSVIIPGQFLTQANLTSIFKQLSEYGILALAVFICMVSGGIDLSVVYIANLCAIVMGTFLSKTIGSGNYVGSPALMITAGCLIVFVIGCICGALNGLLVGRLRVPAMLATLGSGQLILGISTVVTGGQAITGVPSEFTKLAGIRLWIFPLNFLVFVICAVAVYVVMTRTTFGIRTFLIGSNSKAAVFSGVRNNLDLLKAYMISGVLASVSGIISVMRMSSAKPDYGTSYVMFSILICVFGGTNPNGGQGNVSSIVLATIVLQMVATMMNMFHSINSFYRDIVWGALLLIMLIVNYIMDNRHVTGR